MVGDGINDAPALMQADVGIAIGAGTDIAIESSDVVIMGDRLAAVPDTYEISTNSCRKTKQNLALALVFNGIGVPAAASGLVSPVFAMLAMVASVTGVLTNSFAGRLLSGKRLNSGRKQVSAQLLEQRRRGGQPQHEHADERLAEAETAPSTPGEQVVISVPDIHCDACAARIQKPYLDEASRPDTTPRPWWRTGVFAGALLAAFILGVGAWIVYGLGETPGMTTGDRAAGGMGGDMEDLAADAPRIPPVLGYYGGEPVFFIHTEASDAEIAQTLEGMMGSPVPVVGSLAEVPDDARSPVYVFTNGVTPADTPRGPLGFQPDVFATAPGDEDYAGAF